MIRANGTMPSRMLRQNTSASTALTEIPSSLTQSAMTTKRMKGVASTIATAIAIQPTHSPIGMPETSSTAGLAAAARLIRLLTND